MQNVNGSGNWIQVPSEDGTPFDAYLTVPESGSGPGLLLLQEAFGVNVFMREAAERFAEEGYVVIVPDLFWRSERRVDLGYDETSFGVAMSLYQQLDLDQAVTDALAAAEALRQRPECTGEVGALGYCLGGKLAYLAACRGDLVGAVSYYGVGLDSHLDEASSLSCPMVFHFGEADTHAPPAVAEKVRQAFGARDDVEVYVYPGADHGFANDRRTDVYDQPSSMMAHTRSLAVLRKAMGPHFDLSALWDTHCYHEFVTRDVKALMGTMVSEPYVNIVPTVTGGVGHDQLARFYKHHFCDMNPPDTKLVPISRTVGTDRLVDEMLFCFTHDREIDWLLPGVPPTGRWLEIPMVSIVNFRGDKLYHEHIYWDQATVLVQAGLLDPDSKLPVTGIEQSQKLRDDSLPPNGIMAAQWAKSEGRTID
jgi:carboxymethylenebutenolidase